MLQHTYQIPRLLPSLSRRRGGKSGNREVTVEVWEEREGFSVKRTEDDGGHDRCTQLCRGIAAVKEARSVRGCWLDERTVLLPRYNVGESI